MIIFACTCGKSLKADDEAVGKQVKCPGCGQVIVVPVPVASSVVNPETKLPPSPVAPPAVDKSTHIPEAINLDATIAPAASSAHDTGAGDLVAPQQAGATGEFRWLGGYLILRKLGQGGMGAVYEAEDVKLDRKVALKVMKPELATNDDHRSRFLREARIAAKVESDFICPIYQVGEDNGVPFIAMPLLKGEPLDATLRQGIQLPIEEIVRIGREVAEGLSAAHEAGLIHRDIKPGNIWLETQRSGPPRARILDFGLARALTDEVHLTQSGAILGTPAYMSPEQADGDKNVDPRTDLFSLGCMLYALCTGQVPFQANTTMGILKALATKDPTPPHLMTAATPKPLSDLIVHLLAKQPDDRPQTARDVIEELVEIDSTLPKAARTIIRTRTRHPDAKAALSTAPWPLSAGKSAVRTQEMPSDAAPDAPVRKTARARFIMLAICLLGVLALLGGIYYAVSDKGTNKIKPEDEAAGQRQDPQTVPDEEKAVAGGEPRLAAAPFNAAQAKSHQEAWAKYLGVPLEYPNTIGLKLTLIPPAGEELPKAYYLGKYEVTQAEWEQIMRYNPSAFSPKQRLVGMDTSKFPVDQVNWFESVEFCNKLSERDGLNPYYELAVMKRSDTTIDEAEVKILGGSGYHIPTDAEWEHGCRAGSKGKYHFGDNEGDFPEYAWFFRNSERRTHAVGEKKPNGFGLHDMHGNVREWNEEMLKNTTTGAPERTSRGGNCVCQPLNCAVIARELKGPAYRNHGLGLRVARVPAAKELGIGLPEE